MLPLVLQGLRSWKHAQGVALLAVVALAVGIGSTTAIYSVVSEVMLKPLPYRDSSRWVALYGARFSEPGQVNASTYPDMLAYARDMRSFDVFGFFRPVDLDLTSPGAPQNIAGIEVTPSLATHLGVSPERGRWFGDGDYTAAVISHRLWQRLGGRTNILGQAIILNGRSYTVAGVMPRWFRLPVSNPGISNSERIDVWIVLNAPLAAQDSISGLYFAYGRRKTGVSLAQAAADARRVAANIARADRVTHLSYTAEIDDLHEETIKAVRPSLLLLFAAAGLLLLITSANVAGLLLARSVARGRETALRLALGAGFRQLAVQYFSEAFAVALAGALLGVFLSILLVKLVVSLAADYLPRANEIHTSGSVLLFSVGAAVLATVLSSIAPLWQSSRTTPGQSLSDGTRTSVGVRSRRLSSWLVVAEIALAFTLLAVSAVLIDQLRSTLRTSPGFDPHNLLVFDISTPEAQFPNAAKLLPYQQSLLRALSAIPGVESAALVNQVPLNGCCFSSAIFSDGRIIDPNKVERISYMVTSPDYLRTMRIPLVEGRFLTERDTSEDPVRVVVNRAAARYYWPNRDAMGATGRFASRDGSRFQVAGVVGDVRNDQLTNPTVPEIYLSNAILAVHQMHFVVRSPQLPAALVPRIRRAVESVNRLQPINNVQTMSDIIQDSVQLARLSSWLTTFFALAALLMATLGVYGVVAYSVRQRTVEFGTRLAVGAEPQDLLRLVLASGFRMALFGLVPGAIAVTIAIWTLERASVIHAVEPLPFVYSILLIGSVSLVSSLVPAWRASRLSPMVAIRNEPGSLWRQARQNLQKAVSELSGAAGRTRLADDVRSGALLGEFVDAARRAASFREALAAALAAVVRELAAESAFLLAKSADGYACEYALPAEFPAGLKLPEGGLLLTRLSFYRAALPFSESDLETWLRWAGESRPQAVPEIETLRSLHTRLAVPLRTSREIIGVLLLGPSADREAYTEAERQALGTCADQFALMLENARLTERVVEQEKLRRDVALAAEVQRRLLPEHPPESTAGAFSAFSLPARSVGGDYYDFLHVGDHRIGIALADVAGKGVAAALIMSVVQASLRIISAESQTTLAELAARMNRFLHRSTGSNSYATFFYAQLDEQTRQLRYVNAGHNPPYLLRSVAAGLNESAARGHAAIEELETGGLVIGLFPQASYQEATLDLHSGDVFVAFTDGVTEAMDPAEEEFGDDRLKSLLRSVAHLPVDRMAQAIREALQDWIADAPQHDDLTFIVLKVS